MGQAQRRKQLGIYPKVVIKPRKPKVNFDPMDDMSEISILSLVIAGLWSRRNYRPYLREDDFA